MKFAAGSLLLVALALVRPAAGAEIHDAAAAGKLDKVKALLGAHPEQLEAKGTNDGTPLYWASWGGQLPVVEWLLAHQADVMAKDYKGGTPLHLVRKAEVAEVLLAHGADVSARDYKGGTPLHLATCEDLQGVAEVLLAHGADVNAKDKTGQAPLHWAANVALHCPASSPDRKVISALLLAHKANVNAIDRNGKTPLDLAVDGGHKEMAEFLRDHGGK